MGKKKSQQQQQQQPQQPVKQPEPAASSEPEEPVLEKKEAPLPEVKQDPLTMDRNVHGEDQEEEQGGEPEDGEVGPEDVLLEQVEPGESPKLFTLEVLALVKDAQRQYGLRHDDYLRYRHYCTRRIHRVRELLKFTCGKNRFVAKPLTPLKVTDVRYLLIPLFEAERAWAFSMQLKLNAEFEPRKIYNSRGRLRKAVANASRLHDLAQQCGRADPRTLMETTAYAAWMKGAKAFEFQEWEDAFKGFTQAQIVYSKLALVASEANKPFYTQRLEELTASIRYCAYNIGDRPLPHVKGDSSIDSLSLQMEALLAEAKVKQRTTVDEVIWQGEAIPLTDESLRAPLLRAKQLELDIEACKDEREGVDLYDRLFVACNDAMSVITNNIAQDAKSQKMGPQYVLRMRALKNYVTHFKLTHTVARNVLMVDGAQQAYAKGSAKPDDLARLFDLTISNLSELAESDPVKKDEILSHLAQNRIATYRAFKCFYTAESYFFIGKYGEAGALYDRALYYSQLAVAAFHDHDADAQKYLPGLELLQQNVRRSKILIQTQSFLETVSVEQSTPVKADVPLADQPEAYDDALDLKTVRLATFPPEFKPIPCKPLFFDLAYNHVGFPDLEGRKPQKGMLGGVTSMFKGLWGGSKT